MDTDDHSIQVEEKQMKLKEMHPAKSDAGKCFRSPTPTLERRLGALTLPAHPRGARHSLGTVERAPYWPMLR